MTNTTVASLPPYPLHLGRTLSPSEKAELDRALASALARVLALPAEKRDVKTTGEFIASYAKHNAQLTLKNLIAYPTSQHAKMLRSKDQNTIHQITLRLADSYTHPSSQGLDLKILLDLAIVYTSNYASRVRRIFESALEVDPSLELSLQSELLPAFTLLLSSSSTRPSSAGPVSSRNAHSLYTLRKASHLLFSFLFACPPRMLRPFSRSKELFFTLARAYDEGLSNIARNYGGMHVFVSRLNDQHNSAEIDDWERIWLETKVALIDLFHLLISLLVQDISAANEAELVLTSERTFDIIFALLELTPPVRDRTASAPSSSTSIPPTPFLNRSIVLDYHQTYDLSHMLSTALRRAEERNPLLDLLEATLEQHGGRPNPSADSNTSRSKDAGVLRLLLGSPNLPRPTSPSPTNSGQEITRKGNSQTTSTKSDPLITEQIAQILSVLPDLSYSYVHALLTTPGYHFTGNTERIIEAILDGSAPVEKDLMQVSQAIDKAHDSEQRKNVFDEEEMDLIHVTMGKRREDESTSLNDRSFIDAMKADILRRAEALWASDDEDEDEEAVRDPGDKGNSKYNASIVYEDGLVDYNPGIKVIGDGEASSEADTDYEPEEEPGKGVSKGKGKALNPETILELAYLDNPKAFDRDAATRRSKERAILKARTGWADEQIEGWRIMLERNPKKEKILQKHEFAGNRILKQPQLATSDSDSSVSGRGRGGRGSKPHSRGRGGGGTGRGSGDVGERAWKGKHKASQANHNRKRGHDKKMARGGGPSA